MIKAFFHIHLKQLWRLLIEIGLWRSILVLLLFLSLLLILFAKVRTNEVFVSIVAFFIAVSIHLQRNDKRFLKTIHIQEKLLYLFQYQALLSPVYILLLLNERFFSVSLLLIAVSFLPFVSGTFTTSHSIPIKFFPRIPIRNFEVMSGIRKHLFLLLPLYLACFVLYRYPYVALAVIIGFTFISTSFYTEGEPRQMLEVFRLSPGRFLIFKIRNQLLDFWIMCSPLVLLFLIVKTGHWYILLVFVIISSVIQALSVCLKYSFYEPGKNRGQSVFMIVYALSIFVPFFVPVPIIMLFKYSGKARLNLNHYLYDYP